MTVRNAIWACFDYYQLQENVIHFKQIRTVKSKTLQKRMSLLFFLLGLVLLTFLIHRVGLGEVLNAIKNLGFDIFFIFLFPLTWYLIQSFAWWRILHEDGIKTPYAHVFLTKITGEAINTITPVSFFGGDPFRIYLLQKKVSKTNSAASVVIDRTMYMLGVCLLLLVTLIMAWLYLPLPGLWRILFPLFIVIFFTAFVFLVFFQKKGMFGLLSRLVQKIGVQRERLQDISDKIDKLDRQISSFYKKNKAHFFEIMFLHFVGRCLGAVEIFLIVNLLNLSIPFVHCFFMASLTILINMAFVFIPGSMGVMEGGYGALFYLLKLNPAYGVIIQLIRRIRAFFWIGVGLLIILLYRPERFADKE